MPICASFNLELSDMDELPNGSLLLLSDARGIYIPRDFILEVLPECLTGVSDWARNTLADGPDAEGYWDAWSDVCDSARVTDPKSGTVYTVYQDGDCWLIPLTA
jgi:hypothetical protein